MGTKQITVNAEWDAGAKIWVATSDDVPALITETDSVEALADKLSVRIPELLKPTVNEPLFFNRQQYSFPVHAKRHS